MNPVDGRRPDQQGNSAASVKKIDPVSDTSLTAVRMLEDGMDTVKLEQARDYALTGGGSGYITRHGKLILTWGDLKQRYDLKSTTKSFGATALGLAIKDGKMRMVEVVVRLMAAYAEMKR